MSCEPRYQTARNLERETLGPRVAAVAQKLGVPLMPWQRLVVDIGLELRPDGLPAYREVVLTIPRQNGKTTLVISVVLDRVLMWGSRQRSVYTAQTGRDARDKVLDDWVPLVEHSPLKTSLQKVKRVNGSEGISFRGGGQLDVLSSSQDAGHGRTLDLGVIDECWIDTDHRREQAIIPAMSTKRDAQLWVVSTMGTEAGIYLNQKVDACRAQINQPDSVIAYFEWSALEDLDPYDPATWRTCMPALGLTIQEAAIKHAAATMPEGEFRRAYLNQRTDSEERVIPLAVWEAVCGDAVQPDGRLVFAVDANPERSAATIAAADGDGNLEVIDHENGLGWVPARCEQLARKWSTGIALDPGGPAGAFMPELQSRGVRVIECAGRDFAKACGQFFDAVHERHVRVRQNVALNQACSAAAKRLSGDTWTWARRDTRVDISPLVAVTVAHWAAMQQPGPAKYFSAADL